MSRSNLEGITLGKYRILEPLGRGGMAQVYKAYHPQLDRYMAIKILRSDLVENDEFLTRFRQEAHAVSGLRHANIVQVFDFDVQDDSYYMVMELLEGNTLRALLNDYRVRNQRMPLAQVVHVGRAYRFWHRANYWKHTTHSNRRINGHTQLHGARAGIERRKR